MRKGCVIAFGLFLLAQTACGLQQESAPEEGPAPPPRVVRSSVVVPKDRPVEVAEYDNSAPAGEVKFKEAFDADPLKDQAPPGGAFDAGFPPNPGGLPPEIGGLQPARTLPGSGVAKPGQEPGTTKPGKGTGRVGETQPDPPKAVVPPLVDKQRKGKSPEDMSAESMTFAGKNIDEWIQEIPSKDKSRAENAIRTVVLFPPELSQRAVPVILKELNRNKYLYLTDMSIRVNSACALGVILAEHNKPDKDQVKSAVYMLTLLLSDTQVLVKYRALQALASIGPDAASAIPDVVHRLNDTSTWEVRQAAAFALARLGYNKENGPQARTINNNMIKGLYSALKEDTASQVRLAAIKALGSLGPPGDMGDRKIVRNALDVVAREDVDPTVRIWANMAMMSGENKIDPVRLKIISGMLHHDDMFARLEAGRALAIIGEDAKSEISHLIAALDDPGKEKSVPYVAMQALANMGKHALPAIPRLKQIARDEDWPIVLQRAARATISAIENAPDPEKTKSKEKSKDTKK